MVSQSGPARPDSAERCIHKPIPCAGDDQKSCDTPSTKILRIHVRVDHRHALFRRASTKTAGDSVRANRIPVPVVSPMRAKCGLLGERERSKDEYRRQTRDEDARQCGTEAIGVLRAVNREDPIVDTHAEHHQQTDGRHDVDRHAENSEGSRRW